MLYFHCCDQYIVSHTFSISVLHSSGQTKQQIKFPFHYVSDVCLIFDKCWLRRLHYTHFNTAWCKVYINIHIYWFSEAVNKNASLRDPVLFNNESLKLPANSFTANRDHVTLHVGISSSDTALAFFVNPNLSRIKTLLSVNTSGPEYTVGTCKPRDAATYTTRRSMQHSALQISRPVCVQYHDWNTTPRVSVFTSVWIQLRTYKRRIYWKL